MLSFAPLLEGIIDYAGLFPPASLSMDEAVRNLAAYAAGLHAPLLGRFVVPVSRLEELAAAVRVHQPQSPTTRRISALPSANLEADLARVTDWNGDHAGDALMPMAVDCIEFRAETPGQILAASTLLRGAFTAYAEIPVQADPLPLLQVLRGAGVCAKIRTGGIEPAAFPASAHVARFLRACIQCGVPFKATAGLHHAVRGKYRLTYAADSPTCPMYGFLNVLHATALLLQGGDVQTAAGVLERDDPAALAKIDIPGLNDARRFFTAFGSCSFEEPVNELHHLGLI